MYLTDNERYAEITRLEFDIYPALREQFVTLENYRNVRVAELQRADAASGLTEKEREGQRRYRHEWNHSAALQAEFGGNLPAFLAYRVACDKGLVNDSQFKIRRS